MTQRASSGSSLAGATPPMAVPLATPCPPPALGDDVGMRMLLPVGRSWVAIVAGYLGLISVLLVPAPFALFFGAWAIRHVRSAPGRHGMGRAIFGIVMGVPGTIGLVVAIVAMAYR